jgi:hypothetical protein
LALPSGASFARPDDPTQDQAKFFETKIRPVFSSQCYSCHSSQAKKLKGGLSLDTRAGFLKGGENGPVVVPGQPDKSRLILAVRHASEELQMPPKTHLPDPAVADLVAWVKMGAPWPKDSSAPAARAATDLERARKEHWAFQPVRRVPPPAVKTAAWPKDDLDRFILARLEEKGLSPVADADRYTWIRRATFDLIGLPPTPEEVEDFLKDLSPKACEKVADRLLGSPRFGERWGRHWLDIARYAESTGSARNYPYPYAWRYRDYVIAALNADKPYDRFIREQIAGDLLPAATEAERDLQKIATGFLVLNTIDLNEKNSEQFLMDRIGEQIDVTSRAILATTVSCARCHDHKFDPILTADYYALAGVFKSTNDQVGLQNRAGAGKNYYHPDQLLTLGSQKESAPGSAPAPAEPAKKKGKKAARKEDPGASREASAPLAMGVHEATPVDAHICLHGDVEQVGPVVPRGVLPLFKPSRPVVIDRASSGRRELADWLASAENPLTARVIVNRVWQHLFGEGLVPTVDNFGTTGERPTHPELLDHLAARFTGEFGWSLKKLIRGLVLSRVYGLGSEAIPSQMEIDPGNRWRWRMAPRRIDAESLRDALLAVSGKLDVTPPKGSPIQTLPPNAAIGGKKGRNVDFEESFHRSVYLPILREDVPDFLQVFDFADPSTLTGRRDVTTVASQALLLMNSPFIVAQARAGAERLVASTASGDPERVEGAYLVTLGRLPSPAERARALAFVADYPASEKGDRSSPKRQAWAGFFQALLESAEFRYLNVPPPPAERK